MVSLPLQAAGGSYEPLEASWAPPRPELPFQPHLPAGSRRPLALPTRLTRPLSLAELPPLRSQPLRAPEPHARPGSRVADDQGTWAALSGELDRFESGLEADSGASFELHGFLKTSLSHVQQVRTPADDRVLNHFTLDDVQLSFAAESGPLAVFLSADGSSDAGSAYLVRFGEADEFRIQDAWAELRLAEGLFLRAGQFRAPVLFTSQLQANELLFVDYTAIAHQWLLRSPGASLHAVQGRLEGWLALQNGVDETGEDLAWTARASVRLAGEGLAPRREGAYDADLGETLYLGLSWYDDQGIPEGYSIAADAYYTFEAFSLAGELMAPGQGILGGIEVWNATASAMLVPETWELALRYEDFQKRGGAQVVRLGLTRYLHGPDTKLQVGLSQLGQSNGHLDVTALDLTLVASF